MSCSFLRVLGGIIWRNLSAAKWTTTEKLLSVDVGNHFNKCSPQHVAGGRDYASGHYEAVDRVPIGSKFESVGIRHICHTLRPIKCHCRCRICRLGGAFYYAGESVSTDIVEYLCI